MKPGYGNGHFIADAHNPRISLDEMRRRWGKGEYGPIRSDYARGWLALARRGTQ